MPELSIKLEGDKAWPDLRDNPNVLNGMGNDASIQLAVLDHGTTNGRPTVAIRIDLPDGKIVITETTARLFVQVAKIIETKYPGLLDETRTDRFRPVGG